jgi:hypothetical protein
VKSGNARLSTASLAWWLAASSAIPCSGMQAAYAMTTAGPGNSFASMIER